MNPNNSERLFFVKSVEQQDLCGGKFFHVAGSEFARPTDFKRHIYIKHRYLECDICKKNYTHFLNELKEKYEKFPNCCSLHGNLSKEKWFNKKDFDGTPQLVAEKLFNIWDHIQEYYEEKNWRTKIIDFIEYIFQSFGSFPEGYGEPLYFSHLVFNLEHYVMDIKEHPTRKAEILKFIYEYNRPTDNKEDSKSKKTTDFNILIGTYNEWYKAFPFGLSFFSPLRNYFKSNVPIVSSIHTNEYSGLTKATLTTKESLIEYLTNITENVITSINTNALFEQGKLPDIEKTELELIVADRQQKIREGYRSNAQNQDTQYRKILKEWLKDELEFIRSIRPLIEKIEAKETNLHDAILSACYKMQENKIFWSSDENTRTTQVLDLLSLMYSTKNQSLLGESGTGKKQGVIDGMLVGPDKEEYLLEAFNLTDITKDLIQGHISKLEKNYDSKGLRQKYILVYCNVADGKFSAFVDRYRNFIDTEMLFSYEKIRLDSQETRYTNIRQITSTHKREGVQVILHHLLIKMPTKE